MKHATKRNWSEYNQKLKRQASLELYVSTEIFEPYTGKRAPGGVLQYQDALITACLLVREYFSLAFRQTQGFMESLAARFIQTSSQTLKTPDYTTLCRRSKQIEVELAPRLAKPGKRYIIAVDSTGLSLLTSDSWNRYKHRKSRGNHSWHKLHIAVDTDTGEILACDDSAATTNDCLIMPSLLKALPLPEASVDAVCADMAYDTVKCRRAIDELGATQRIPPKSSAVPTCQRKNPPPESIRKILHQRDAAILYNQANSINGSKATARKQWKKLTGYHRRSIVETAMSRLKAHTECSLTAKLPETQKTQCRIKCKLLNILNQA